MSDKLTEQYQIVFMLTFAPADDVQANPEFMTKELVYEFLLKSLSQFIAAMPPGKMAAVRMVLAEKVGDAKTKVPDKSPGGGEPGGSGPGPNPIPRT